MSGLLVGIVIQVPSSNDEISKLENSLSEEPPVEQAEDSSVSSYNKNNKKNVEETSERGLSQHSPLHKTSCIIDDVLATLNETEHDLRDTSRTVVDVLPSLVRHSLDSPPCQPWRSSEENRKTFVRRCNSEDFDRFKPSWCEHTIDSVEAPRRPTRSLDMFLLPAYSSHRPPAWDRARGAPR